MARENRDRWTTGSGGDEARRAAAAPAGDGRTSPDVAVPAQRTGHPTAPPPPAPPPPPVPPASATSPSPAPPVTGPPATPLSKAPLSAAPSDDPGATGRNDGSRTPAPAATPAAPRGRDTAAGPTGTTDNGTGTSTGAETGTVRAERGDRGERRDHHVHGTGTPPTADGPRAEHAPGRRPEDALPGGHRTTGPEGIDGHGAHGRLPGGGQLLDDGDRDRLGERLHHALAGFVDSPRDAVAEAADVLDEAEKRLLASLKERRTALRAGWQRNGDPRDRAADTEQLRLTLRTYREVTERLLGA
ncbi:hypothetical protein [Streptomyces sp. NPDC005805]|uniref:hypothetical protein n=1 Tax=Streptomyces sp. NPDC005805 TaxID=3157068 RepID=UPI0033D0BF91